MRDFLSRAWPPVLATPHPQHPCLIGNLMAGGSVTATEDYRPAAMGGAAGGFGLALFSLMIKPST